jgi:hypothetical protein
MFRLRNGLIHLPVNRDSGYDAGTGGCDFHSPVRAAVRSGLFCSTGSEPFAFLEVNRDGYFHRGCEGLGSAEFGDPRLHCLSAQPALSPPSVPANGWTILRAERALAGAPACRGCAPFTLAGTASPASGAALSALLPSHD